MWYECLYCFIIFSSKNECTSFQVNLTLWGDEAENFDAVGQPVIALKQGKISEFGGGKSVNIIGSSVLQINPDIPEAHKLRGWFDGLSQDAQFNSISARGGGSDSMFCLSPILGYYFN